MPEYTTDVEPLFLTKAKRLYAALDALAEDEFVDGLPARLFRGKLQTVYKDVRPKLSSSHYARLNRGLKQCGSMTMLQRGARNTETIIVLHHEPTVEQWTAYERSPLTGKIDYASLRERIDSIEEEGDDKRDALQQLVEEVERQGQQIERLTNQVEALKPK
jgi:hypothetical protein